MNVKKNSKITMREIVIMLFPFVVFVGPYVKISVLNASNLFMLPLFIYGVVAVLKNRFQYNVGYIIYFLIISIYACTSIIWSTNQALGLQILFAWITGFCTMTFIASFSEQEILLLIKSMKKFTIMVILLAVYEILTGSYLFFNNIEFIYQKNSYGLNYPGVFFVNPNDLGYYLSISLPLMMIMYTSNFLGKIMATLIVILSAFVLFNTDSRLSIIGALLIVFVYCSLMMITNAKKAIKFVFSGCLILFSSILLAILNGIDIFELLNYDDLFKINMNESYYTGRSSIYQEGFNIGLNYFPFGAGLGSVYSLLGIPPHSMFLFIWADMGALICISFILFCCFALLSLWRMRFIKICGLELNKLLLSILCIFPMLSLISSGAEQRKITWIFFGFILASINISRQKICLQKKSVNVKK